MSQSIVFRTAYDRKRFAGLSFDKDSSLTKQSHADECDINVIMKKYQETGLLDHVQKVQGFHGDFSEIGSFHEALALVDDAYDAFMQLPSDLRERFDNDPSSFMNYMENASRDDLEKMGLVSPLSSPENSSEALDKADNNAEAQ